MKKVIVTDPCYLINDDDWRKMIAECEDIKGKDWTSLFNKYVENFLIEKSGDKLAVVGDTGFGDWTNEIDGVEFGADSGMVCVVELTAEFKKYLEEKGISVMPGLAALLSVSDDADYEIDRKDPHWSVVRIFDENGVISSIEASEEE